MTYLRKFSLIGALIITGGMSMSQTTHGFHCTVAGEGSPSLCEVAKKTWDQQSRPDMATVSITITERPLGLSVEGQLHGPDGLIREEEMAITTVDRPKDNRPKDNSATHYERFFAKFFQTLLKE